ncbi:cupin domain-containing protein [Dankookia sp. P2]|uniref:cupin domain-containing protein n=1 Tax=Dankookia sp. P2 TaxID=3423955 RepID=UPI003D66E9DB
MSQTAEAKSLWFMNGHVTVHLAMAEHAGGFSITEHKLPAGFGPPYHVHHNEDETFYLLDGEIRCKQAERILHAKAGDVVHLGRGIPHGFKVVSPGGARVLIVSTGGFEAMLRAASVVASSDSLPEPREPTPEMQARLAQICAENGIELLGPPID